MDQKPPKLTREQAAIISVYTGFLCGPFEDVQKLGDELMGRPTWTHEYGIKKFSNELKERAKPLFLELCFKLPEPETKP